MVEGGEGERDTHGRHDNNTERNSGGGENDEFECKDKGKAGAPRTDRKGKGRADSEPKAFYGHRVILEVCLIQHIVFYTLE